jgi:group I intron endonuclease
MTCGIYKITSPSGRIYIGQSIDIERRWTKYLGEHCKNQIKLYCSFKKYGVEAHVFEVIEECEVEHLNIKERYWQDFYKCMEGGLNCLLTQTDEKPKILSKETKQKIRLSSLGKKMSEEACRKIGYLSSNRSPETKKKIGDAHRGGKSKQAKKLIDTKTNIIYSCMKEAAESIGMKPNTLVCMMSKKDRKNKTSLIYYNENKS